MKIRNGFVSNSSTTSFHIYGLNLSSEQQEQLKEKHDLKSLYCLERLEGFNKALELHSGEWDNWYLGCSWEKMGEDETFAQFKERVGKMLNDLFGTEVDGSCSFYEESWFNG